MDTKELTELLGRLARAVEANDGDALADCFTANGIYKDYFFGQQEGRSGIKQMLAHFYEGANNFRWEFFDCVADGCRGYARYRFSYDSLQPQVKGKRIGFDGISCVELRDSRISCYSEVFDRGMALAQQDFAPEHISRIEMKHARALRDDPNWTAHFPS